MKETQNLNPGSAISPIDGRYHAKTVELSKFFSEWALMKYRLLIEIEYLIALSDIAKVIRPMNTDEKSFLRNLYGQFSDENFLAIKDYEKKTNHDVNAVVRYLKGVLEEGHLHDLAEFVHIGLTSEDVNNLSFAFMLRGGTGVLTNYYINTSSVMSSMAKDHKNMPMLARTHGQPASPTTIDWEINVFVKRMQTAIEDLMSFNLLVKFGGATGAHNALRVAYPKVNWRSFSESFIVRLNKIGKMGMLFKHNPYTTQIEPHDTYAKLFGNLTRANTILIDFSKDMWMYIAFEVFTQKAIPGEDGSSAMPNKVNPIDFENAEGNLGIANALFNHFTAVLPISRMQRHLTDSTVIRNFGPAFAYTLISLKALIKGMDKLFVNIDGVYKTLNENWGVVSEAYQTILRANGVRGGYDLLKEVTRDKEVTEKILHSFVDRLAKEENLSAELVKRLKGITPHNYIGDRRID